MHQQKFPGPSVWCNTADCAAAVALALGVAQQSELPESHHAQTAYCRPPSSFWHLECHGITVRNESRTTVCFWRDFFFWSHGQTYTDRSLWIKNGAIHRRAQRLEVFKVEKAIKYLLESLQKRPAGGDSGHDFMRRLLQDCVVELESCVSTRHSEIALADRRRKQALEEEQKRKAAPKIDAIYHECLCVAQRWRKRRQRRR